MGKLFFVRHGQTSFNIRNNQWHEAGDPVSDQGFQFTTEYIDPPLTQLGQEQILLNKSQVLQQQIDLVYVSPMLRTLQTCQLLFSDPETRPKIRLNPFVTEWVHVNHDVPSWPNTYREEFKEYDWSMMPDDYFIKLILKNKFGERIDSGRYVESLLEIMKEALPEVVESRVELYRRAQMVKEKMREETREKNVLIVGHSAFYRHLTCHMVDESEFVDEERLENGEMAEVKL